MTGVGYGWIAPTLVNLQKAGSELQLNDEETSWMASLHEVTHAIGPIFSFMFLDRIGRKNCFIISSFLLFLTWLLTIFARSISLVYLTRLIFGFAISINELTSSIYLGENCSPSIRGIICSLLPLCHYAGVFVEFVVATYLPYSTVAIINTIFGFITVLTIFLLKETPYYLVMKGHFKGAEKTLTWLNGDICENESKIEIEKIKENIQLEKVKKNSYLTLFSSPENYKTVVTVFIITMLWVLSGFNSINSYASTIFLSSTLTANEFTILLGIVQFGAACISPFIVERYNRRTLLMISFLTMTLSQGATFILFRTGFVSHHNVYFPWLLFASVALYSFTLALVYPAVFIIRGELLPLSVKAIGGFLTVSVDSLASFLTIRLFPIITQQYGIEFNFLLYCTASMLGCVYIYLALPETRGKSLIDIQKSIKQT
ncbi:hypothetical protein V9T40_010927 [Parthenolecanium corni]|uniref:Major facilitator superfamily (MFS) profile domain-containing protein n=1 Tax=Parthenolecanium corni TaxID=536013 RepID=A0AAN9TJ11_9HEMI